MAGNNAVAVVQIGRTGMQVAGLIPVGWYPTAVTTAADGRTLFVANGKGNGSGANRDGTYIRSEEHTSELQSRFDLVCRLLLEKKKIKSVLTDLLHAVDPLL